MLNSLFLKYAQDDQAKNKFKRSKLPLQTMEATLCLASYEEYFESLNVVNLEVIQFFIGYYLLCSGSFQIYTLINNLQSFKWISQQLILRRPSLARSYIFLEKTTSSTPASLAAQLELKLTYNKVEFEHKNQQLYKIIVQNLKQLHSFLISNTRICYVIVPYYVLALLSSTGLSNQKANPFLLLVIVYMIFPFLDEIFTLDQRNPSQQERRNLQKDDAYFRMTLYAAMIMDWAIFIKIAIMMTTYQLSVSNLAQLLGIIFISSNLSSVQFAVAHEVMHKPEKFYRVLGTLHMSKLYYMHFTYHHLYRHHHQVATPNDPSTSRKGQNVYQFIVRCIRDSWLGVYQTQKSLKKPFYKNYAILSILSSLTFGALVYIIFGLQSFLVHNCIAFGAIFYLQAINYIEHYGLERKKLQNGSYEKVTILHSWNAPHRFTNYLLFKLQRHSDHHQNSLKPFQTLNSLQQSPFLPHGYTLMILMSFFPQVWFRVMDPLAQAYGKLSIADRGQIDGSIRQKSLLQTRKFMVKVALVLLLVLGLSLTKLI